MDQDLAVQLMDYLSEVTSGWTEEAHGAYVRELVQLDDTEAAARAIHHTAHTWDRGIRPPFARIMQVYKEEVARKRAEIGTAVVYDEPIPTFGEGIGIARRAYIAERNRLGKPLSLDMFDGFIQTVPQPAAPEDEPF